MPRVQNTTNFCMGASEEQRVQLHKVSIAEKAGNRLQDRTRLEERDHVPENTGK